MCVCVCVCVCVYAYKVCALFEQKERCKDKLRKHRLQVEEVRYNHTPPLQAQAHEQSGTRQEEVQVQVQLDPRTGEEEETAASSTRLHCWGGAEGGGAA